MKNKEIKKIQFGQYNKREYKEIRKLVKGKIEKELDIKLS